MIEPPKLYTDARRQYDLRDVDVLATFSLELGLHVHPNVANIFAHLIESAGTATFAPQYTNVYAFIMTKGMTKMEPAEVGGAGDGVEMFLSRMAQRRSEPVFGVAPRAIVVSPMATTTANGAGPISSPWTPSSGGRQPRAQSGRIGTQRGSPYRSPHSDGGRAPAIGQMSTMSPTGPHRTKFERRFSSPTALSKSNPASASLIMAEGRGSTQSFCAIQQPPYGLLRASGWHTHYSNMRRSSMSLMSADKDTGVLTWNRSTPSVTTSSTCQSLLVGDSSSVATTQMPQRSAHASTSSLTSRYADELRPPHEYLSIVQNNSQVLLEHVFANKTQVDSDPLAKASKSIDAVAVATLSTTPTSEGIVTTDAQSETRCSPIRLMAEEVTRHHWSARASAPMTAQRRDTLFAASLDNAVTISNEKIPVTVKDEVSAAAELFDAWICIN